MMNVLWLVGMLFAGQYGQSVPAASAEQRTLVALVEAKCTSCESPDRAEILRALPPVQRGIPNVYEVWRDDVEIKTEKLVDKVDAPRFFPLAGPAKLHHLHWKCTVSYNETVKIWFPIPMMARTKRTEVIYIDKDRLILCDAAKCPCEAKPDQRVVTCWDERVQICPDAVHSRNSLSVLKGSVYLFNGKSNQTMAANGILLIEACDRAGTKLAQWHFDPVSLEKLKRTDLIGVGYTLCLPLDQRCLTEKDIQLTLTYRTNDGKSCCDEPTRVSLRGDAPAIVRAVHAVPASFSALPVGMPAEQVRLSIVAVRTKPGAMKRLDIEFKKSEESTEFAVLDTRDNVAAHLKTLCDEGNASMLASHHLSTLSGRPVRFKCGGAVIERAGDTDTHDDAINMNLMPIVWDDGKMSIEFAGCGASASANFKHGQTLVIRHPYSTAFGKEKQDLVIIVTPKRVNPAPAKASKQMTFTEIVTLAKRGINDDIIIRQMELTESRYELTTEQILSLHDQGVSDAVIRAMQDRRPAAATPAIQALPPLKF